MPHLSHTSQQHLFHHLKADVWIRAAPNKRMKLSARGGHIWGQESVLSVAAAGRSLCAIR